MDRLYVKHALKSVIQNSILLITLKKGKSDSTNNLSLIKLKLLKKIYINIK